MLYVPSIKVHVTQHLLPEQQVIRHDPGFLPSFSPDDQGIAGMIVAQSRAVRERFHPDFWAFASSYDAAVEQALREKPFSFDLDTLSEPCSAPTLIVTGRQDHIAGYHQAWAILENFPRGTFVVLDRAGHLLGLEQPALFQALVSEWLDRVEEYIGERE